MGQQFRTQHAGFDIAFVSDGLAFTLCGAKKLVYYLPRYLR
jgi:hypothetical protein